MIDERLIDVWQIKKLNMSFIDIFGDHTLIFILKNNHIQRFAALVHYIISTATFQCFVLDIAPGLYFLIR